MDDGRAFLAAIRKGWRWREGRLWFSKMWEEEDTRASYTPSEITRRVLHSSMNEVLDFLNFTTEIGEQYEGGWLPTLDLDLKVDNKYYEKPTTTEVTVQARSAMNENIKIKILANDLRRILSNMHEGLDPGVLGEVVHNYVQKLLNSGVKIEKVA